jgi:hypothetical protein
MHRVIVKNQHTFPKRSLERFLNDESSIYVRRLSGNEPFPVKPDNQIFCVTRKWCQSSEQGIGKGVEDKYQAVIEELLVNKRTELRPAESEIVNQFYALWKYRTCIDEFEDKINSLNLTPTALTSKEKKALELSHISYVDETGSFPNRNIKSVIMHGGIINFLDKHRNTPWILVESPDCELIIPDNPGNDMYIPVTPHWCLLAGNPVKSLTVEQSGQANLASLAKSNQYIAGRSLSGYINA